MPVPWARRHFLDPSDPAGGIDATVDEMASYALLQFGDGTTSDQRVLSAQMLGEFHRPEVEVGTRDYEAIWRGRNADPPVKQLRDTTATVLRVSFGSKFPVLARRWQGLKSAPSSRRLAVWQRSLTEPIADGYPAVQLTADPRGWRHGLLILPIPAILSRQGAVSRTACRRALQMAMGPSS